MARTISVFVVFTFLCAQANARGFELSGDTVFFGQLEQIRSVLSFDDADDADAGPGIAVPPTPVDTALEAVLERLEGSGVPRAYVIEAFAGPTVQIHEEIAGFFNRLSEEAIFPERDVNFLTEARIRGGVKFYNAQEKIIAAVSAEFGVDPFILVSIIGVESNYGKYCGRYRVFNALYSIIHKVPRRSEWAVRELAEFFKIYYPSGMDLHGVYGSYAGAFGYAQFIPSSFNEFAVDFDGDGIRSHLSWPDVIASVANYLVKKGGYEVGGSDFSQGSNIWESIFAYNHSIFYVESIFGLRKLIKDRIQAPGINVSS